MASQESGGLSSSPENQGNDDAHPQDPDGSGETDLPNTSGKPTSPAILSAKQNKKQVDSCQYFMMGKCRFGNRCRLAHSEPPLDDLETVSAERNNDENLEKNKKKAKGNKTAKPKDYDEKEMNKKPRMRTADDVISRILWDPSVDSSQFVVGYVDRFLGVLERPFCDFNWETNPCDCDYNTELALPRHRIQYFTYRGHRVWDRHSRTDRVFGSTGQPLAPPFGGEEEVEEDLERPAVIEDGPPAASGREETETEPCSKNTHLEEEQQKELNIYTRDSAPTAPQCKGSTSQEPQGLQETCAAVKTTNRNSIVEEETLAVLEEGLESNEDSLNCESTLNINDNPKVPLEQEKRGGRPPKKRPTHFVTFRANTPAILSCFQQLQEEITAALPCSDPHWQSVSSLHVTLCLLVLPGPAEVAAAADILRRFAQLDRNPPVAVTFPVKLKHFNGRVLFLSPQPQLHLQHLNNGLQEAYREEGLLHRDSYNPRYHLTLAKVEGQEGDRVFEGVENLKVGKGLNFGRLPVNTLHLCTVGGSKVDGFFEILCTVTLR